MSISCRDGGFIRVHWRLFTVLARLARACCKSAHPPQTPLPPEAQLRPQVRSQAQRLCENDEFEQEATEITESEESNLSLFPLFPPVFTQSRNLGTRSVGPLLQQPLAS